MTNLDGVLKWKTSVILTVSLKGNTSMESKISEHGIILLHKTR